MEETTTESPGSLLTNREVQVLQCFADGMTMSEVASALAISAKTVKNHLASAYASLDVGDRTQAVVRAIRLGLVTLD